MSKSNFRSLFSFDASKAFEVGVEREMFLLHRSEFDGVKPWAERVLQDKTLRDNLGNRVGYELSACQIETRVGPCSVENLLGELISTQKTVDECLARYSLEASHREVSYHVPLDVYPDERYLAIVKTMPSKVLHAACSIIGTHIHVGMPDAETALRIYNHAVAYAGKLWSVGDHYNGKRRELYSIVAPNYVAKCFDDWDGFYLDAVEQGYDKDVRKNWREIRISRFGTIEFRMFGATSDAEEIADWGKTCRNICLAAR